MPLIWLINFIVCCEFVVFTCYFPMSLVLESESMCLLLNSLTSVMLSSSNVWQDSPGKPSGPRLFFMEKLVISNSISLLTLFWLSVSPQISLDCLSVSESVTYLSFKIPNLFFTPSLSTSSPLLCWWWHHSLAKILIMFSFSIIDFCFYYFPYFHVFINFLSGDYHLASVRDLICILPGPFVFWVSH